MKVGKIFKFKGNYPQRKHHKLLNEIFKYKLLVHRTLIDKLVLNFKYGIPNIY